MLEGLTIALWVSRPCPRCSGGMGNSQTSCCSQKKDGRFEVDGEVMSTVIDEAAPFTENNTFGETAKAAPGDSTNIDKTKIEAFDDASTVTPRTLDTDRRSHTTEEYSSEHKASAINVDPSPPIQVQEVAAVEGPTDLVFRQRSPNSPDSPVISPTHEKSALTVASVTVPAHVLGAVAPKAAARKKKGGFACCGSKSKVLEDSENETQPMIKAEEAESGGNDPACRVCKTSPIRLDARGHCQTCGSATW